MGGIAMSGKKGMKHYPASVKEHAVRMHLDGGLTKRETSERLGIADPDLIKKWCAKFRKSGTDGLCYKSKGRPRKYPRTEQQQIEHEVKRLKMENDLLRNFLYEVERGC